MYAGAVRAVAQSSETHHEEIYLAYSARSKLKQKKDQLNAKACVILN